MLKQPPALALAVEEDEITRRRYDPGRYAAALAYYGLPTGWPRVFSPLPLPLPVRASNDSDSDSDSEPGSGSGSGKNHAKGYRRLRATTPLKAARTPDGGPVWVQINEPRPGTACDRAGRPKKARTDEIAIVRNLTLDFEYPPAPALAHVVGSELAYLLVAEGLAEPGLAVEDSGGGCHLVIPLQPISTGEGELEGGSVAVNRAVRQVVAQYIEPVFGRLVEGYGLGEHGGGGRMRLEGYDLAHLLSVPGTWRPSTKRDDCPALKGGYLRRWLPPHDRYPPRRRESANLTRLIMDMVREKPTDEELITSHKRQQPSTAVSFVGVNSTYRLQSSLTPPLQLPANRKPARPPGDRYGWAALVGEVERVRTAPVGQGNNCLNLAAFRLGQLVALGLLDPRQVEDELERAATEGGRRSPSEARQTIKSGLTSGLNSPRHLVSSV